MLQGGDCFKKLTGDSFGSCLVGNCWPSEVGQLASASADTAKVCCRCEERHVFVGDSWPPKSWNSQWECHGYLWLVKVLAFRKWLLTSGSILCLWNLQRMFWRRVFCVQKPIVGTLEKKGTTAMGSHSEVLWSSVCRCGFKVKGLACQMLYSRRRTTDFAFNSSSIDSFQRSSHKKRRARRAVSASSKYAHLCSQLCQGTFLGCFATFLQCQTQSHRQTVREDFDWWELRCECLNSNVF